MRFLFRAVSLLLAGLAPAAAQSPYTVVRVDPQAEHLQLFLRDERGAYFHRLPRLAAALSARGRRLRFGMNAGMFHPGFAPVGLLVIDGRELSPINLASGSGNFFLKPNGVFLVDETGPRIVESSDYAALGTTVQLATQSGPLLVQHGTLHPRLDPGSRSRHLRNGVGVANGVAYFVISNRPVNFHEFALYFRDTLHCDDALYLDGSISSLFSRDEGRADSRHDLGPIIAVVE